MIHTSDNTVVHFQLDLNPQRRREMIAQCNATLQGARARLMEENRRLGGLRACREFSDAVDDLLHTIYDWLPREARLDPADYRRICLVAQGGYGRREMNPFSDIDLLFLMPDNPRPVEQAFVKSFLYLLWDLNKVELGHATKRVSEALDAVGLDLDSTTSLITVRHLAGNETPLNELRRKLATLLKSKSGRKWFIECKLHESQARREKYGSSIYLLEPNVKDGEGGLRDLHSIRWLTYTMLGSSSLETLAERGILTSAEVGALNEALDFMLSVRTALHQAEGRKVDGLTFDKQPAVAASLGFTSDPELLAEEKMMKNYYLHARSIDRYGQKAIRVLTVKARTALGGVIEAIGRRSVNKVYCLKNGVLHMKHPDADYFRADPVRVMECFWTATETGAVMSEELKDLIIEARPATSNEAFRTSPRCRDLFMRIMGRTRHVAQTMHAMHDTGTLTDYMPEFEKLYCMARIDHYHKYTVDEHLIKTLEVSEALINGAEGEHPDLVDAARQIRRWDLLNLSLLLHDIGKGQGHGHVLRGAILSQQMTQRMGLPPADQEIVRQLILQHLKMVHMSQRRDLEDPHVIREMADTVPDPELLRMLYVLTYCDTRAVGPTAWTDWKAVLLADLYHKTALALAGKNPIKPFDEAQRARVAARIREAYPEEIDAAEVDQFLNNVPRKYLTSVPPARIARHMHLLRQLTPENQIVWEVTEPEHYNYTEITAISCDVRGFLSWMCAALSSKDINILSLQAYSTKDGYAIDTFQVTDLRGNRLPHGFRLDRLRSDLNQVIQGKARPEEMFPVRRRPLPPRTDLQLIKPNQIIFNNDSSPDYTILEVKACDRPGLLYDITSTCTAQGYFIHLAMITTEAYRVVDVFYITDLENNKLEPPRIKRLEAALNKVVE